MQVHISIYPSISLKTEHHIDCPEKNKKYNLKKQQSLYCSLSCLATGKNVFLRHNLNASKPETSL